MIRVDLRMPIQLANTMRDRLLKEHFKQWFQTQLSQLSEHDPRWMRIVPPSETEVNEDAAN